MHHGIRIRCAKHSDLAELLAACLLKKKACHEITSHRYSTADGHDGYHPSRNLVLGRLAGSAGASIAVRVELVEQAIRTSSRTEPDSPCAMVRIRVGKPSCRVSALVLVFAVRHNPSPQRAHAGHEERRRVGAEVGEEKRQCVNHYLQNTSSLAGSKEKK